MLDNAESRIQVDFLNNYYFLCPWNGLFLVCICWNLLIISILCTVDVADELDAEDIAKKLKPFRQLVDDAAVERELEAELQKDYLFASALHGHKMSLVKQDRGPSPPPAPIQHRKIRRSDLNIGKNIIYFLMKRMMILMTD